jgi:hypothetical protein
MPTSTTNALCISSSVTTEANLATAAHALQPKSPANKRFLRRARLPPAGRLAQLGERLPYKQEVGGSIPSPPMA